ncbi:hypothetical protein T4E_8751 [Trichinella pseudospiralis]|uniref:BAR domain-containing protein n=1 Tax=Trichinella pseudospiralis TaxID=6337 RepID=A0A0V0XQP2_TRIPS|nr:hypothetical protein T4E_8751 [Trichinella pseudospiralis]
MSVLAALVFFFMAVISEINADSDALKEAKSYIYSSDLQKPDGNFRKVISVSKVDRSDGLSMAMDVLPTSCPVSSKLSQEKVYSDACPVSNEYEKIECQLKLDENKNGQLKCHLIKSSKTTKYQEEFNKQFEQIMHIERCLKETIKSIRRFTDPNSKFTLMSSFIGENKMSDVDLFSDCLLRMKQKCINKSSEKFLTFVALAEVKIEAAKTLRNQQIQSFSIDPLNKILEEKIESVKKVKVKLDRARTEYDTALEKLKAANEKNLYQLYNIMEEKKKAFETQAHIMAQWMDSMPDVEKMIAKTAFIFFFMAVVMPEINADSSALEEAKEYIYAFDSQGGRGNFRKVLSVKDVDRSDGLSLTLEALPTTCPVSSDMSMDKVYSDECPTTTEEYDQIECRLKLDASKAGHIECTYYAS